MKRRDVLLLAGVVLAPMVKATPLPGVTVFKDEGCGCCEAWVEHLKAAGFTVNATNVPDVKAASRRSGVPETLMGCHTARADGYVIEGHVPAQDIKRLIATRPQMLGLSVPGMPVGAPGMEVGTRVDPYEVLLFDRQGRTSVFSRYPKS